MNCRTLGDNVDRKFLGGMVLAFSEGEVRGFTQSSAVWARPRRHPPTTKSSVVCKGNETKAFILATDVFWAVRK